MIALRPNFPTDRTLRAYVRFTPRKRTFASRRRHVRFVPLTEFGRPHSFACGTLESAIDFLVPAHGLNTERQDCRCYYLAGRN